MSGPAEIAAEAVDACYDAFGVAASYTPPGGGPASPCAVIRDARDRDLAGGRGPAVMRGTTIRMRKAEVAAPQKGGTVTLAESGEVLTILGDPVTPDDDPERLEWEFGAG